jgi:predicted transcriptional regulator
MLGQSLDLLSTPRQRIIDVVAAHPGISFDALRARAGCPGGAAGYHLHILERAGVVQSVKYGRYRRYFPATMPTLEARAIAVAANPSTGAVLERVLAEGRPLSMGEVAASFPQVPRQNVAYHVHRLAEAGLLEVRRIGRSKVVEAVVA